MRTCIDNRKRKVFNDIKHLSTKAVLLIIFLSLLPALQVMAMETPDETQQKSTIRVQGRVLDEFNQPLPGVSILAVKSTKGVITDIDGNYSIEVAPDEKLEFSYIGYQKNVVLVNGRKDIPIKMEPLTSELKEVTVVGYGTQRKASVIGAITGLPVGKINRSVNKLSNVLAGQMAGVVAVQRSGEPYTCKKHCRKSPFGSVFCYMRFYFSFARRIAGIIRAKSVQHSARVALSCGAKLPSGRPESSPCVCP